MSNKTFSLSDELHSYLLSVSPKEPEFLTRLRTETASDSMHAMQIAPEQGMFMSLLLRAIGARNTLEIGVYTGYSALVTALSIPDDGKVVACDISREWTDIGQRYWTEAGVRQKIDLRIGPAAQTLDTLISNGGSGTYDFAFIDADKPNYWEYLERSLVLLRRGGVIAVDNVLWSGKVADPATEDSDARALHAFNTRLAADQRVQISMVPIADGLTLAMKI
ncbi:MAG: class I SAM-dependent methyltransferase [Ignavibacteria bacterium]|nr:class I SAM-dependent methyltransferase [Ignavibacteria bacterium]